MRRFLLALCAGLLMAALLPAALAVTVIAPKGDGMAKRLAEAQAEIRARQVGRYGMAPVTADSVAEGSYPVAVESSSAFFKVLDATLEVADGEMALTFLIGSDSYARVCRASAADAEAAAWIEAEPASGGTRFTVPVPALNQPFELAAYSRKRQQWYDRLLLVDAASLPEGALAFELPDYELIERAVAAYQVAGMAEEEAPAPAAAPEATEIDLPDGEYAIEVTLAGGSGRASVSSPTLMIVRDGRAYARLLWSSAYFDYMLLGGARFENQTEDGGNSTFEIPITAMDAPMDVVADTTAMGEPIEIDYQLTFYAESVGDRRQVPQEAAKQVLAIALAVIVLGGILNHFIKRKRK